MVICIYGFPTNVSHLQFEWAWQHPHESVAVRQAAATFKSLSGVANKIKLAYTMLTLPSWKSLNITVNFFSTKYTNNSAGCPSLPEQMKVKVCAMDELPCYTEPDEFECKDYFDDLELYDKVSNTCETVQETYPNEAGTVSADNLNNIIYEASDEQFEHLEEYGTRKPGESSSPGACDVESLVFINSPTTKTDECADMSVAGKESLRGMWLTYDVESDDDPKPWVKEKLSTTDKENEKLGESSTLGVYHTQPLDYICSPVQTSSNGDTDEGTDISIIETKCRIQKQFSDLVTANGDRQPWTREKLLTCEVAVSKDQDPSSNVAREVEVIDLLTPSPSYRVRLCTKTRRISKFSTVIIDLT